MKGLPKGFARAGLARAMEPARKIANPPATRPTNPLCADDSGPRGSWLPEAARTNLGLGAACKLRIEIWREIGRVDETDRWG